MVAVVVFLIAAIAVAGLVVFFRAVFGGSTFRRARPEKGGDEAGNRPGDRPDSHAGASSWTGGGGAGRWGTWSGDA